MVERPPATNQSRDRSSSPVLESRSCSDVIHRRSMFRKVLMGDELGLRMQRVIVCAIRISIGDQWRTRQLVEEGRRAEAK